MFLGRIITNSKSVDTVNFVDVTNDKSKVNDNIPTIIIGKKLADDIFGADNVHYLNKKLNENLWWTFAKTERRNEYEKDLKEFNSLIVKQLNNCVKYTHINIFTQPLSVIKRLITFVDGDIEKVIYVTNEHIYIYADGKVVGLSVSDLNYIGLSKKRIMDRLSKNHKNTIITNNFFLNKNLKKMVNGNKIIVPYMYFLDKK